VPPEGQGFPLPSVPFDEFAAKLPAPEVGTPTLDEEDTHPFYYFTKWHEDQTPLEERTTLTQELQDSEKALFEAYSTHLASMIALLRIGLAKE